MNLKRADLAHLLRRERWLIYGPAVALVLLAFFFASRFLQPPPQKHIAISAGAEGGAYFRYAQEYRDILKRDGITLEVKPSAGSLQNLQRLRGDAPQAVTGMVQGGTTDPEDSSTLLSLGGMFYEPVWIFHRLAPNTDRLAQLRGRKIAIGPAGSGTRHLARQMLQINDISEVNSTLRELSTKEALQALLKGDIDAALFVASPDAEAVQTLLRAPNVRLMSLAQAEAYARRYPYLAHIVLHKGVVDLAGGIPAQDVNLVAAIAILAVRDDLHPALQFLLTQAAAEVHRKSGIFNGSKYFPQVRESELPVSEVAERYSKNGPPFLQRYLPFWLAVLMERLIVFLLPLITVALPAMKIMPEIFDWRIKRRLWHWYEELKKLERAIAETPDDRARHVTELKRIDDAVQDIPVPVKYADQHYNLRAHIEYVQRRLAGQPAIAPVAMRSN
jgi:TRAP transporter TAXI family solute receptor